MRCFGCITSGQLQQWGLRPSWFVLSLLSLYQHIERSWSYSLLGEEGCSVCVCDTSFWQKNADRGNVGSKEKKSKHVWRRWKIWPRRLEMFFVRFAWVLWRVKKWSIWISTVLISSNLASHTYNICPYHHVDNKKRCTCRPWVYGSDFDLGGSESWYVLSESKESSTPSWSMLLTAAI